MVKRLLATILTCSPILLFSQSIQLGLGAEGNLNNVIVNPDSKSVIGTTWGDTLHFKHQSVTMPFSYKIPIFFRYKMNNGLWFELNYATENINIESTGDANHPDEVLADWVNEYLVQDLWPEYDAMYNGNPNYGLDTITQTEFLEQYWSAAFQKEYDFWNEKFTYLQRTSYNSLGIQIGYTFLRTKKIRPFISTGFTWSSQKHKYQLKSLSYSADSKNYTEFNNYYDLLQEMPELNHNLFFVSLNLGMEIHKMRFGISARTTINSLEQSKFEIERLTQDQTLKMMWSLGAYANFSLFDFNLRDAGDRKKLKDDELKVLGDYKEKKKKIKLSVGLDLPFYTDISNHFEQTNPDSASLSWYTNEGEEWPIIENVWIYHQKAVLEPDEVNSTIEDNAYSEIIALGNIKMIRQFPQLSFNMEYEPVDWFSMETKIGYQFNEIHTQGRYIFQKISYFELYDSLGNFEGWDYYSDESMRPIVFRETFHNISIAERLNFKFTVVPGFMIGFSGGAKANLFLPGKFRIDEVNYNNIDLLSDFNDYWTNGNNDKNWVDYEDYTNGMYYDDYNFFYFDEMVIQSDQLGDYIDFEQTFNDVGEDQRMSNFKNKINFTWMAGIDFYFERLRFNIYTEGAITDINFLYRDYLSVGMGIHYYIRK